MSEVSNHSDHIIFFLKLEKTLPKTFFHLAANLNLSGVTLIPVNFTELIRLMSDSKNKIYNKINLVAFTWNLESKRKLLTSANFLKVGLIQGKLSLYHLSSFPAMWDQKMNMKDIRNYYHYDLPMALSDFSHTLSSIYFKEQVQTQSWPGGKRAKLPHI